MSKLTPIDNESYQVRKNIKDNSWFSKRLIMDTFDYIDSILTQYSHLIPKVLHPTITKIGTRVEALLLGNEEWNQSR